MEQKQKQKQPHLKPNVLVVALAAVFVTWNVNVVCALSLNESLNIDNEVVWFDAAVSAPTQSQPVMVALTLIDSAASKGAGASRFPFNKYSVYIVFVYLSIRDCV
jgi:hypothetical protein